MTVAGVTICVIAVILAYLIGAFPSAHVITRLAARKGTPKAGTGHTGAGNTATRRVPDNVSKAAMVAGAIIDVALGAGAVILAGILVERAHVPADAAAFAVFGAGVAALVGHQWPVYLRFAGGGGLAVAFGVLAILLTRELMLGLAFGLVLAVATRNLSLSAVLGLLWIPVNAWWDARPWWKTAYPVLLLAVMLLHSMPGIVAEMREGKSPGQILRRRLGRDMPQKARPRR